MRGFFLAPLLALISIASPASAKDDVHLRAEVGTDFPLAVGLRIASEWPYRLRITTSLGYLPEAYIRALNGVLVDAGAYNRATANLIGDGLKSSVVFRTHVGWRPFPASGFYFEAGYGLMGFGGGTTPVEVTSAVTRITLPNVQDASAPVLIKSLVQMVDVEVGWEWKVWKYTSLRMALGGAFTIGADSTVRTDVRSVSSELVRHFEDTAAGALDNIYRKYVFTPVLSISAGYVFF